VPRRIEQLRDHLDPRVPELPAQLAEHGYADAAKPVALTILTGAGLEKAPENLRRRQVSESFEASVDVVDHEMLGVLCEEWNDWVLSD